MVNSQCAPNEQHFFLLFFGYAGVAGNDERDGIWEFLLNIMLFSSAYNKLLML